MSTAGAASHASGSPWNAEQREWLQAMGHEVLVLAPRDTPPPDAVAHPEAPLARSADLDAPSADSALLRALARAAGRKDVAELAAVLPDPASLRGNPAAKRALWPRLRALRRDRTSA